MFVRLKAGARTGEVHEMKFADAQPLLADGRAEQVYAETSSTSEAGPKNGQAVMKPSARKGKKK